MRRDITTLALALLVLGCSAAQAGRSAAPSGEPSVAPSGETSAGPSGTPVELGRISPDPPCQDQWVEGSLRADVEVQTYIGTSSGMTIEVDTGIWPEPSGVDPVPFVRLYWPSDHTGVRLADGEVAVLDGAGRLVATTGSKYQFRGQWRVLGSVGGPKFPYSWIDGFVVCRDSGSVILAVK